MLYFEAMLPSIAEPLSEFDVNTNMYDKMTTEMINHIEQISVQLAHAVNLHRSCYDGKGFEQRENPFLKDKEYQELATAEERAKTRIKLDKEWEQNKLGNLYNYIKQRVEKAPTSQNGVVWRKQRIKELQAELRRLAELEAHEKRQQEQQQEQTQNNSEISQQ
jgi:hypothetical protein